MGTRTGKVKGWWGSRRWWGLRGGEGQGMWVVGSRGGEMGGGMVKGVG